MTTEQQWHEFEIVGPIETMRYRVTLDARRVEFYSAHRVPGMARQGWNVTHSATVEIMARKALKALQS